MEKQISVVDWLVEQIKNNVHNSSEEFELIVNQAKLMEHEQRGNSFIEGYKKRAELSNLIFDKLSELFAKELFNKTNKSYGRN